MRCFGSMARSRESWRGENRKNWGNVKGERINEQEEAIHCLPKEAKLPNMAADGSSGAANDVRYRSSRC